MKDIILIDLDGVLADASWREHYIKSEGWEKFHSLMHEDQPCEDMVKFIREVRREYMVVGCTGRPERYRSVTNTWLLMHEIYLDDLLMRGDKDFRSAVNVKVDLADAFTEGRITERIMMVIDDRDDIVKAFQQLGVTGLVVHKRSYE